MVAMHGEGCRRSSLTGRDREWTRTRPTPWAEWSVQGKGGSQTCIPRSAWRRPRRPVAKLLRAAVPPRSASPPRLPAPHAAAPVSAGPGEALHGEAARGLPATAGSVLPPRPAPAGAPPASRPTPCSPEARPAHPRLRGRPQPLPAPRPDARADRGRDSSPLRRSGSGRPRPPPPDGPGRRPAGTGQGARAAAVRPQKTAGVCCRPQHIPQCQCVQVAASPCDLTLFRGARTLPGRAPAPSTAADFPIIGSRASRAGADSSPHGREASARPRRRRG